MRRYYSSRTKPSSFSLEDPYRKVQNLYLMFRDRDFFKDKAGITRYDLPNGIRHKAVVALTYQPFPIEGWGQDEITDEHVFETLEFLYDHVSKPGEWGQKQTGSGYFYDDYIDYDEVAGKEEFRKTTNVFLADYKTGFELTKNGTILAIGTHGLQHILSADIVPYDEKNVDSKVRSAIAKWRNRQLSVSEKREAIRELADVFEWLKKTKRLDAVLDAKDEAAIFDIANNFGIRHHNPKQKTNYDPTIWYSWMLHFYLATYHAVIRFLLKKENSGSADAKPQSSP